MKTKKIISVLLVCFMLLSVVSVSAFAAEYYSTSIFKEPYTTFYTDAETFDPSGLVITYALSTNGVNMNENYSAGSPKFSFSIPLDKTLSVSDTSVTVYYDGVECGSVQITVTHASAAKWTSASDTQHGHVCAGCGEIIDLEDHSFSPWVPNDDARFLIPETETAHCTVCGAEFTREIAGTEGYLSVFAEYPTLATLIGFISLIVKTIVHN